MFGRFFALEMGCPDNDSTPGSKTINTPETVAYLNEDGTITPAPGSKSSKHHQDPQSDEDQDQGDKAEGEEECDCQGMGCKKCRGKKVKFKVKVITLTGPRTSVVPVMNLMPFQPSMIMLARRNLF